MSVTIDIKSRKIVRSLSYFAAGFLLASIASHILKYGFGLMPELFRWFNIDGEKNFPAAFSAALLLLCAVLLLIVAVAKRADSDPFTYHWMGLSCIFLLLGTDEWVSLHEKAGIFISTRLPTSNAFHFAWIVIGLIFVAAVGLTYGRFLARLPRQYRRLFLIAAGIYITGAIGMEMVGGYYVDNHQQWSPTIWLLLTTIEEGLEMIGMLIFAYALLTYIQTFIGELNIRIAPSAITSLAPSEQLAELAEQRIDSRSSHL